VQNAPLLNCVYIDESRWPEVKCTFLGVPEDDKLGVLLERLAFYLRRNDRHAYVIDLQAIELPSRGKRAAFLQALKPHEFLITSNVAGVALVFPPNTLAFARSTMMLTRSALAPYTIVDSVEAAQAWCQLQIGHKTPSARARHKASG
jgi:hypothetical protein